MNRTLVGFCAAAVIAGATFLASPAADATGDSYYWVGSPGPGDDLFSDPANWEHGADDGPGVPGPLDFAMIDDPDEPVLVTEDVTVVALVLAAPQDDQVDLRIGGDSGGSLTAQLVSLTGDSHLGDVRTHDLQLSGSFTADTDGVQLVESSGGARGIMVLDDATSPSVFDLDDGPVQIVVAGEEPSTVEGIVAPDVELHLVSEDGGTYDGRVFGGDITIVGDVPADAIVYGGTDGDHVGGTLTWAEPDDAVLSGLVRVSELWSATLPDDLTVDGILDLLGPTTGGSLAVGPGGAVRFTDRGPTGHREADLVLSGSFESDPTGGIWVEPSDEVCVGDEDLLVRAAGGVTFPPGETHLDAPPTWFELEGIALHDELVAVARRTGPGDEDRCIDGGSERVARAMYRDLLGRVGDGSGTAYWARKLDGGTSAVTVASRLLSTDEARVHLVRSTWDGWACDGEPPSDGAVALGAEYLRAGGSLPSLRAEVVAGTVPGDGDPVDCLYQAVLGRGPDAGGRAYAERRLETESVQKVAKRLMATSEGRRVQVDRLYRHLLGRDATSGEVTTRQQQLAQGRTEVWITAQVAGSTEYAQRSSV